MIDYQRQSKINDYAVFQFRDPALPGFLDLPLCRYRYILILAWICDLLCLVGTYTHETFVACGEQAATKAYGPSLWNNPLSYIATDDR